MMFLGKHTGYAPGTSTDVKIQCLNADIRILNNNIRILTGILMEIVED